MGEPVRIVELARAMIELSGLDPRSRRRRRDRRPASPGEKLNEALFNSYERPRPTDAEKIMLAEREPMAVEAVESMFAEIGLLVLEGDAAGLAAKVSELSAARLDAAVSGVDEQVAAGIDRPGEDGERPGEDRANGGPPTGAPRRGAPPLVHSPHS